MENKKTEELRKYKTSIKSKLMASIAMLLVSTILLSSTTYAWFILSTAPEVTGMTTTVGSNGSLEIALLNNDTGVDTTEISSGVGDSSAAQDVTAANESWGNIVDLSAGYGLNNITLYPSALNLAEGNTGLLNLYSALSVPVYGVDGRVAELSADNVVAGKLTEDNYFVGNNADYGVRAIGTSDEVDPLGQTLANAQSYYRVALRNAQTTAQNALNGTNAANATALAKLLISNVIENYEMPADYEVNIEVTPNDETALGNMINGLEETITYIEAALTLYAVGYEASLGNVVSETEINLANYSNLSNYVAALTQLQNDVGDAQSAYTDAVESDDYSAVLEILLEQEGAYINDVPLSEYDRDDAMTLFSEPRIVVTEGLLADVATFVDSFVSSEFTIETGSIPITNATITASPNEDVASAYLPYLQNDATVGLNNLTTPDGGTGEVMIVTQYGYAIDLAFRASTGTDLLLSEATQRVASSEETTTQGGGSTFSLISGEITDLEALRIVFVDTDTYAIIGVAAPDTTAQTGPYELHMYDWSVNEDGALVLGAQKADDTITSLTASQVKKITVLVYLEGNDVSSAMAGAQGTLNLQFASSAELSPMDYSGYVTTVDNGENNNGENQENGGEENSGDDSGAGT